MKKNFTPSGPGKGPKFALTRMASAVGHVTSCGQVSSPSLAPDPSPPAGRIVAKRKAPKCTPSTMLKGLRLDHHKTQDSWVFRHFNHPAGIATHWTLGSPPAISELDACILVRDKLAAIAAGANPTGRDRTVEDFVRHVRFPNAMSELKSHKDVVSTAENYVLPFLGSMPMSKVTPRHLECHKAAMCNGQIIGVRGNKLKGSVINHTISELRVIFRLAFETGEIPTNPAADLKFLKLDNCRKVTYSEEELRKIFDGLGAANPLVRLFFLWLLATGLRSGEVRNATYENLDEAARTLLVTDTKSKRPVLQPLSDVVMASLPELKSLAVPANKHLFPAARGDGAMWPPRKSFQKVLAELGINGKTFHDARRTAISKAVESPGVSVLVASKMANHASTAITEARYIVVADERVRHAVEQVSTGLNLHRALRVKSEPGQPDRPQG